VAHGKTTLLIDPSLPPKTWETRNEKRRSLGKTRRELTEEAFVAALDDEKVREIAVGEEVHADLRRVMGKPGVRTPRQRAAEAAAGIARKDAPRARRGKTEKTAAPAGTFHVDRSTFGGFEPEPPGTQGPGGVAS
jgi:hypothetical protein